jgi:hypothetical protein
MTARLTNAVGTRLGLTHSWKTKSVLNAKKQAGELFRREQGYNLRVNTLFNQRQFKKQSVLRGAYVRHYNLKNKVILDVFLYDTAFERVRRGVKLLRKLTAFIERVGGQYYQERKLLTLQNSDTIPPHSLFSKLYMQANKVDSVQNKNKSLMNAPVALFQKGLESRYFNFIKPAATSRITQIQQMYNKRLRKRIVYYLMRNHFIANTFRLKQRILFFNRLRASQLKVNLISIPKVYVTITMIMSFIIKRLYLNYTIHECINHFKKYLKLTTRGYTLRACGKLTKKQRAWYVKRRRSRTKLNNLGESVSYIHAAATLKYGKVGVKLWINF